MVDQNIPDPNMSDLRTRAEHSVVQKDGHWCINFDKSLNIQGFDENRTYTSKEIAVDTALNFLKSQPRTSAA